MFNAMRTRPAIVSFIWQAAFVGASYLSPFVLYAPKVVFPVQSILATIAVAVAAYQQHEENRRLGIPSLYVDSLKRLTLIGLIYGPLVFVVTILLSLLPALILHDMSQTQLTNRNISQLFFIMLFVVLLWYHSVRVMGSGLSRQLDRSVFNSPDTDKNKNDSPKRSSSDHEPSFLFLLFKLLSEVTGALLLLVVPLMILQLKLAPLSLSPVVQVGIAAIWVCLYSVTLVSFFLRTQTASGHTTFRFTNATSWPVSPLSGNRSEFLHHLANTTPDPFSSENKSLDGYKALQKDIPEINDRFQDYVVSLFNNGRLNEAVMFVREALEHAPHATTLYYGTAVHLEAGYLDEARGLLHGFADLEPDKTSPALEQQFFWLWLEYCLIRGDLKAAERVIRKHDAYLGNQKDVNHLTRKAAYYLYRAKPHNALLLLNEVARHYENWQKRPTMHLAYIAWAYGQKRDKSLADDFFKRALENVTEPSKSLLTELYLIGGYTSLALGDSQEAEARFTTSIASCPNTIYAHLARVALETRFESDPPQPPQPV